MANKEQFEILKTGVTIWNDWRKENPNIKIDLSLADLREVDLKGAFLNEADLWRANLSEANLSEAILLGADLEESLLAKADLTRSNLGKADFTGATLNEANLTGALCLATNFTRYNLQAAILENAELRSANFEAANFQETILWGAVFFHATLSRANFISAHIGQTIFSYTDLSQALNLDRAISDFGSSISEDTLAKSKGHIPEPFLRGCGLSDWQIETAKLYNPELTNEEIIRIQYRIYDLRATQALQISPLFISYSHGDKHFIDTLDAALTSRGVRFWRDIHDMTAGRMETQIDRAIRQNPTVLLILSKNSLNSDWVQHEVRKARELEKEMGREVLCPVALDDSWKSAPWPQRIMEQVMEYNILDFSGWEDVTKFNEVFAKLLSGLDLFYKKSDE